MKNAEALDIYAEWETQAQKMVDTFYALYPNFGSAVQVAFIANTVAARSEKAVLDLERAPIVSGVGAAKVHEAIHAIHDDRLAESRRLLNPSPDFLLGRIPLFEGLDKRVIERLASTAKRHVLAAQNSVVKEGEEGDSLYLIIAGILEVSSDQMAALGLKPRLFTGDFFGEMSLLFKRPRSATVKTVVPSEVIEIGQDSFNELMNEFPEIKSKVDAIARQRDEENQQAA